MKKYLLLLAFSIFAFPVQAQKKQEVGQFKFSFYTNDTIASRLGEKVRSDSTYNQTTGLLIFKSYDRNGGIIQEMTYNQHQSNAQNGYATRNVFDAKGNILLHEHFNLLGTLIERYRYSYNNKGLLEKKEGFGSGEIGIAVKYIYSNNGDLIDAKAYRGGHEVKDFYKNMKK